MSPAQRSISDSELTLLKILWDRGACSVRDLLAVLDTRDDSSDWAYNTVQTLMQRLLQKGFVSSDRQSRAHVFSATVSREELLNEQLQGIAERIGDGSAASLVQGLVLGKQLKAGEIRELRQLLEQLESERTRSRAGKAKGRSSGRAKRSSG